jgi:biopolymer transport protein ExbD
MGGGGGGGDGEPEFQIAPMIDVLLTLLIFFMSITSAEVSKIDKDILVPVAPDAKERDKAQTQNEGSLNVRFDAAKNGSSINYIGKIYEDVQPIIDDLKAKKEANDKYRVIIRGDKRLPAIEIQRVMTLISQAGIDDIVFSTLNQ